MRVERWPEDVKTRDVAVLCAHLCDQKKAKGIVVLNMSKALLITDYFVIATGLNRRHVQGMAADIERELKTRKVPKVSVEGMEAATWVLLDYGGIVVHLFQEAQREYYDLDHLWEDAPRVRWSRVDVAEAAERAATGE